MQPIIALFAPGGLILYYAATKRNLLTHFQRPNYHYSTINKSVDFLLSLSLIAFGLGNFFVYNWITNDLPNSGSETKYQNLIITLIGLGFVIILPLRIFYCCIPKVEIAQNDYIDKKMLLLNDYDRLNPLTKDVAIDEFKTYIDNIGNEKSLPGRFDYLKFRINNEIANRQRKHGNRNIMESYLKSGIMGSGIEKGNEPKYNNELNKYKDIAATFQQNAE
jgi:hypothetical protein